MARDLQPMRPARCHIIARLFGSQASTALAHFSNTMTYTVIQPIMKREETRNLA